MCTLHNYLILTLKFNIEIFMADKKDGKAEQSSDNIIPIIVLSIILTTVLGSLIYTILMKFFGFNDDYAGLTSIAICTFIAYKYFKNDKKAKITDVNVKNEKLKTSSYSSKNTNNIPVEEKTIKSNNTTLNENERNQSELDKYLNKNHSKEEIGLFYERYVGYVFESKGWDGMSYTTGLKKEKKTKA